MARVGCLGRGPPANWPGGPPPGMRCPGPVGAPPGLRSNIGLPRCSPGPVLAPAAGAVGGTIDALYTGRGPVCGITMRRAGGADGARLWVRCGAVDSAAIAGTDVAASGAGAATSAAGATATGGSMMAAAGASAGAGAATVGALAAGALSAGFACSSRATGAAAGGLTATPPGGGATTTTGRADEAPAGGLATTAPAGGREAMAGVDGGGATIGGAERGWGTILRGSGRA